MKPTVSNFVSKNCLIINPTIIEVAVSSAIDELKLMFKLMDRVAEGVTPMLSDLEQHIVSSGLADMFASADIVTQDSEKYVEHLLDLFTRFSTLVTDAFGDDPRFLTVRDKAFKRVVNDTQVFKLDLPSKQVHKRRLRVTLND